MKPATIALIAAIPLLGVMIIGITAFAFVFGPSPGGYASVTGGEVWASTLTEAKARSQESGNPVIAVFSASWCPPCKSMKKNVYPQPEVIAELEDYWEPVYVDTDNAPELAQMYRIRSIPTYVLLDVDGEEFDRFSGGYSSGSSWIQRLNQRR